jgi:hypothetical protein
MSGAIPPSWRGAQLREKSTGTILPYLYLNNNNNNNNNTFIIIIIIIINLPERLDSSVSIVTRLGAGRPSSIPGRRKDFVPSPPLCQDRLWCPRSLLSNGQRGLCPWL